MEEYIRVTGKTVEDALLEASIMLGTTSDNIEYRVIEHESKGFLGIGARKAVIEARARKTEEDFISEIFSEKPVKEQKEKAPKKEKKAVKAAEKKEKKEEKKEEKASEKKAEKPAEKKEKNPEKKEKSAEKKKEKSAVKKEKPEKPEVKEIKETKEAKEAIKEPAPVSTAKEEKAPRQPADPEAAAQKAQTFLKDLLSAMGIEGEITTSFEDNTLNVNINGDDMGLLIGKRGQTLDSVQYLTSLVVNKGKSAYIRVRVDTEDYRERRKATLENLARNMAFKVKKTRRSAFLEPMNPYERRIIHAALQNDPYVTTHSEGEEPFRKVVVTLKKRSDADWSMPEENNDDIE